MMGYNRIWRRFLVLVVFSLVGSAANAGIQPGKDYELMSPALAVETGKKIEVLEIFSYSCPHCADLEPDLVKWVKTLPKDVEFRRLPGIFQDSWIPFSKIYFSLEALGLTEKLHGEVFKAIHAQRIRLNDESTLFDWVEKQGVNRKAFADIYQSFSMQSKVMRAKQLTRDYGLSGVPAIIVDGKYRTYISMGGGHAGMFAIVDQLVKQARQERAKTK